MRRRLYERMNGMSCRPRKFREIRGTTVKYTPIILTSFNVFLQTHLQHLSVTQVPKNVLLHEEELLTFLHVLLKCFLFVSTTTGA